MGKDYNKAGALSKMLEEAKTGPADGAGSTELIWPSEDATVFPGALTQDGKTLLTQELYGGGSFRIGIL